MVGLEDSTHPTVLSVSLKGSPNDFDIQGMDDPLGRVFGDAGGWIADFNVQVQAPLFVQGEDIPSRNFNLKRIDWVLHGPKLDRPLVGMPLHGKSARRSIDFREQTCPLYSQGKHR